MKVNLYEVRNGALMDQKDQVNQEINPQLIFTFGNLKELQDEQNQSLLKSTFPNADIVYCTSVGQIVMNEISNEVLSVTAIEFSSTQTKSLCLNISDYATKEEARIAIANQIKTEELSHILLFVDGMNVNPTEVLSCINEITQNKICITGGLASDEARFEDASIGLNEKPKPGKIIAIGFYGDKIHIHHSTCGGWEVFGMPKTVTKQEQNILFEIDDQPALDLYKEYLGKYVEGLPQSALFFPLAILNMDNENILTRTILSVDHANKSLIFAGDMPQGSKIQFMKSTLNKLIEASENADMIVKTKNTSQVIDYVLAISCVGRKLVLKHRIDEEVEKLYNIFGENTKLSGFYSHGEVAPFSNGSTSFFCKTKP